MKFNFAVRFGGKLVKSYEFNQDLVTIGREETCDIAIDNLETAYKFSSKKFSYGVKTYNYIEICFHKSRDGDIGLNFKHLPESKLPY